MTLILVIEIFDIWVLQFIGPFVRADMIKYILVVVGYISKLLDVVAL